MLIRKPLIRQNLFLKEDEEMKDDLEKTSFVSEEKDTLLARVILNICLFLGLFVIIMVFYSSVAMIFLLSLFIEIFSSLGITNWRVFGMYYDITPGIGGSFGFNGFAVDALFFDFLVTLCIWILSHNQLIKRILDIIETSEGSN